MLKYDKKIAKILKELKELLDERRKGVIHNFEEEYIPNLKYESDRYLRLFESIEIYKKKIAPLPLVEQIEELRECITYAIENAYSQKELQPAEDVEVCLDFLLERQSKGEDIEKDFAFLYVAALSNL